MTKKPKKVRRPKGEPPVPNPDAEARALESMGGEMPEDDSKKRRPKGEPPTPNEKAEKRAKDKAKTHGEPVWFVAENVEFRCLRGKMTEGMPVFPHYFAGGAKVLVEMAATGHLVRGK